MKIGYGEALGKIILMGEHSVVYGKPAIAIPLKDTKICVTITQKCGDVSISSMFFEGMMMEEHQELIGIREMVIQSFKKLNKPLKDMHISITSNLPPQRGLGSSAAVSIAVARAIFDYFQKDITIPDLIALSLISERINHGKPSGLDSATIANEHGVVFENGQIKRFIDVSLDAYLVVADTGKQSLTKEAVAHVRTYIEQKMNGYKKIDILGKLTDNAILMIEEKKLQKLGAIMNQAHKVLKELGVTDDVLDRYVDVAMSSGALGAKMTGGGMGGCIIALCDHKKDAQHVQQQLNNVGAKATWIYNLSDLNKAL